MIDLRVLDLFSGIGGFSLGLERAGMTTVAFCEQDGYARRVLKKHWPDVWLYEDVRTLTAKRLRKDGLDPNVICGGFPCQDISTAGKGAGITGERSGLWKQMLRIIREVKPLWVVAENVPALRSRGADEVLADLEGAGYTAWPNVVGAVNVGANHKRERVWIVGHSNGYSSKRGESTDVLEPSVASANSLAHAASKRHHHVSFRRDTILGGGSETLPHPSGSGLQTRRTDRLGESPPRPSSPAQRRWWKTEPRVGRVADGVPARVDRLRCLGNAVVPLIPELIGRAIIEYEAVA